MKKTLSLAVVLCMLVSLFSGLTLVSAAAFSGAGSGTDGDPYVITNTAQFKEIASFKTAEFKLEADSPIELDSSYTAISGFKGKLIGTNGKNVINLNIDRSSTAAHATIFHSVQSGAVIDNLTITGTIVGNPDAAYYTSSLVGYIEQDVTNGKITISNIDNRANITINRTGENVRSGGIIGLINASRNAEYIGKTVIENCSNHGDIVYTGGRDKSDVGGIVASISALDGDEVEVLNCSNYGKIISGTVADDEDKTVTPKLGTLGGIVGGVFKQGTVIKNCANFGTLHGAGQIGGIVGRSSKVYTIEQCFNTGAIISTGTSGNGGVGGILIGNTSSQQVTIKNCFNAGTITAERASGLAYMFGANGNCPVIIDGFYNVGDINYTNGTYSGATYACYSPKEENQKNTYYLSGQKLSNYDKVSKALTANELQSALPAGFSKDVWTYTSMDDGNFYLYPQLKDNIYVDNKAPEGWNTTEFAGGNGTVDFPYQIAEKAHLMNVSKYPSANFKQTADITDEVTEPVNGENDFSGSYDGNGHSILLNIASEEGYVGLFSKMNSASVSNLTVTGSVTGGYTEGIQDSGGNPLSGVGGIAGGVYKSTFINCVNRADITSTAGSAVGGIVGDSYYYFDSSKANTNRYQNCTNYGTITGVNSYIAGIVGIASQATITGCANYGDVNGDSAVGGITGMVYHLISDCLNTGSITGKNFVGGIGGQLRATYPLNNTTGISNCYNIGTIKATSRNASAFGSASHTDFPLAFTNCYNAGEVIPSDEKQVILSAGGSKITYTNCYALTANAEADGLSGIDGVTPVDKAGLKTAALGSAYRVDASAAYPYPQLTANQQSKAWDFALLTVTAGENGTASYAGSKYVKDGSSYELTFTPAENYILDKILINTVEQPNTGATINVAINGDTTVSASFAERPAVAPEAIAVAAPFIPEAGNGSYTFASINYGYGYNVLSYGILYSEDENTIKTAPETCETVLKAETAANAKGQFGIQLTGALPESGYYTRAYVTYADTETQTPVTVYSEVVVEVK